MKRGGYIKRKTPLRKRRAKPRRTTVRRDPKYLAWIRTLPCEVAADYYIDTQYECLGRVHAHHAGRRPGAGMKADDWTAIPFCAKHHDEWHRLAGYFHGWARGLRKEWATVVIAKYQAAYLASTACPPGAK